MICQTGQALDFTGDTGQTGAPHRSDGVAQNTNKNNFKHLLISSTNWNWCVAFVDEHKQGNDPCTHK
jgi:hypothetical protein